VSGSPSAAAAARQNSLLAIVSSQVAISRPRAPRFQSNRAPMHDARSAFMTGDRHGIPQDTPLGKTKTTHDTPTSHHTWAVTTHGIVYQGMYWREHASQPAAC
jgi:hypothetical protein